MQGDCCTKASVLLRLLLILFPVAGLHRLKVTDSAFDGVPSGLVTAINNVSLVTSLITGCTPAAVPHTFGLGNYRTILTPFLFKE